jgi:hypothetical protein
MRALITATHALKRYEPSDGDRWAEADARLASSVLREGAG